MVVKNHSNSIYHKKNDVDDDKDDNNGAEDDGSKMTAITDFSINSLTEGLTSDLTSTNDVKDVLHGEEEEAREDLTSALQMMKQSFAADFQTLIHVFQDLQNVCQKHKNTHMELKPYEKITAKIYFNNLATKMSVKAINLK